MPKKNPLIPLDNNLIADQLPVGMLIFDKDFLVKYINPTFYRMGILNPSFPEDIIKIDLMKVNLFKNISIIEHLKLLAKGIPFEKEIKRIFSKQQNISIVCKAVPINQEGIFSGGIIIVEDLRAIHELTMSTNIQTEKVGDVLSGAFDVIFITDGEGLISFYGGKNFNKYFNSNSEIINSNISSLVDLSSVEIYSDKSFIKQELPVKPFLVKHINNDEVFHLNLLFIPFNDPLDKLQYLIAIEDISIYSQTINKLERQNKELADYSLIAEGGGLSLFSVNSALKILTWSKEAESLFGFKKINVFGKHISSLIKDFDDDKSVFKSVYFKQEGRGFGEFRIIPDGDKRDKRLVIICRDIYDEELQQKKLELQIKHLTTMLNSSDDLICMFDTTGRITKGNSRFYSALGYDTKRNDITLFDIFEEKEFSLDVVAELGILKKHLFVKSGFGKSFIAEVTFIYQEEFEGIISSYGCLIRDISSREKTKQDILMMQSIFEASNDGIAVVSEGNLNFVNNSFVRIFGYSTELDIVGRPISNFLLDINSLLNEIFDETTTSNIECKGYKKDSSTFLAEVYTASFEFNLKTFKVLIIRDITEIRLSQKLIEDSEAKYRSIAENIDDFLWVSEIVNNKLIPMFVTASFVVMTGFKTKEFVGNNQFWFRIIHPEDLESYFSDLKNLLRNRYKNSGAVECRIITKNGSSIWVKNKITLVREGEKIVKMFGLVSDITKQKQAEEEIRRSTENLKKLNETKDRFISIISHDMRTPFSSILGFTDFILSEEMTAEEMKKYVTYIQDSTKIMLGLVNSLLDWTRLQTGRMKFEPVKQNLHLIVSKSLSAVSGTALQKNIKLFNNIPDDIVVFVDQNLMLQVFNNLFSNAIKFTPENGIVTAGITGRIDGRFLEVFVQDSGVGIRQIDLPKVFKVDTKFTTVGTAGEKGTGLGLSLVKEIIEKHGGSINLESKEGEGTKFIFTLPAASSKILLVENSPTDRVLYAKIIGNLAPGYEVEQAKDTEGAIKSIDSNLPALIISAHQLKSGTGLDLIKLVNSSSDRARIPFIILGTNLGKSEHIAYKESNVEWLFSKPVNLQKFKEAIQNSVKTIFSSTTK
jgi:PAS domain S-box-containing protein